MCLTAIASSPGWPMRRSSSCVAPLATEAVFNREVLARLEPEFVAEVLGQRRKSLTLSAVRGSTI